ncbi:MAG: NAD(P)/FAD-dependent oxidoreductase [Roseburia sp.]|nr:NAD(P)/FAD-dependent oxidoreductase [Roseburia sp.]
MIQTDVAVIGGGAAGLMAAITAARAGAKTLIIEHMDRVGKKILATGNGKCNYTNALQGTPFYRGENPAFVMPVFQQFGLEDTLAFFQQIGIYPKCRNGYYYPSSEQAASVLDVLRMEADYQKVDIETSCEIKNIKRQNGSYKISTNKDSFLAKNIIFTPGLLASPKTGSDGSAFPYIEKFGHHFIDIVPALVGLQGRQSFFKALAGIRAEASIELYVETLQMRSPKSYDFNCNISEKESFKGKTQEKEQNYKLICTEQGELQLTDYGISGIPVFQISRYATRALHEGKKVYASIDFMPRLEHPALLALLTERFGVQAHEKTTSEALVGLFNKKLIDVLLKESGIDLRLPAKKIKKTQLQQLCETVKAFRVDITGSKSFDQAQVCAGGVDTSEINAQTMESKFVHGVYFAGEVVDIDGTCGGYNLQWAWSSGYVAGTHAAERAKNC